MRLPRLTLPALRSGVVLNSALGVVALLGAGIAYHLLTATAQTTPTSTGGSRTVAVTQGTVTATVSASGAVQSASTASADFTTSGTVMSISVKVGDTVQKGQELARVDPASAQASVDTAYANLAAAKASLTRAQSGGDDATIAAAQAQVTTANAAADAANRALSGTILTAPMAGTVTAVSGSIGGSSSGSSASSGSGSAGAGGGNGSSSAASSGSGSGSASGFIQLADLTKLQVAASFAETDATRLKTGQTATVTWAALPGASATGTVSTIAPTASTSNNVNSYAVVVALTDVPAGVRLGQTVTVDVVVGNADNVIRVPTAAVRTAGTRHLVTVVTNGVSETREVQVGVQGDTFVEITSGLDVGEQVAIVVSTTGTNSNTGGFPGGFGGGGLGGGNVRRGGTGTGGTR